LFVTPRVTSRDLVVNSDSLKTAQIVFVLILLTIGFRIVQLSADPPANFSWSGGEFADEGYWSHNARNSALFGQRVLDQWDARAVSPIFASIQTVMFRLFGVGFIQVRLIGIISSLLITIAVYFLVRKSYDAGTAFFCATLITLSYPMLVLGRQGILDPFAAALVVIAFLCAESNSKWIVLLSGVLFVAACVTKYLMIFAAIPLLFSVKDRKVFVGGVIAAGVLWLFGNYFPNQELLTSYGKYYSSQQSWQISAVIKNIVLQPFYLYFVKTPAILFFGNLMLWYLLFAPKSKMEKTIWLWLLTGIVFFALWRYRPIRYYTSLLPPLACLAGMAFTRIADVEKDLRSRFWIWIGMAMPAVQIGFVLIDRFCNLNYVPEQLGISTIDALIFLALTGTSFFFWKRPRWVLIAFASAFLLGDMRSYLTWMIHPQFQAQEISRDLEQRIGNQTVTGQWAPELALENHMRVVPVWYGFVNSDNPFEKYNIRYILVWKYALGGEKYDQWYPNEFQKFAPEARYKIKDSELILYKRK
jgi:4-amino-4-deoxy-L-arabinose transferase-like glycosyltransferase